MKLSHRINISYENKPHYVEYIQRKGGLITFKINDHVVYGATGVCRITDIIKDKFSSSNETETEYYVLQPVYNTNVTIKTPVNNSNAAMRPIISKDEILALIAMMPEIEPVLVDNEKQRSEQFRAALKTGKTEEWIKIIKTLYLDKKAKSAVNKKLTKTEEGIMNSAEKQLNEEFATALNISPDEVVPYILDRMPE
ncbi:CarD family transcriptional regulator [Sporomusa aerivorans]|uniref:CarD family transcriptional regulator n=1 Tax=Sporomusa aerivorans TaxID=204936 RepID=UPI00352B866C